MTAYIFLLSLSVGISTHTLTWSVTYAELLGSLNKGISTHTLTWSVTYCYCYAKVQVRNFNSHAHVERDAR